MPAGDPTYRGTSERRGMPLSPREQQALSLLAGGMLNKEIARAMTISDQTVKNHLTVSFEKLGVSSRVEAALVMIERDAQHAEEVAARATRREYEIVEELAALNYALMHRIHWNTDIPRPLRHRRGGCSITSGPNRSC